MFNLPGAGGVPQAFARDRLAEPERDRSAGFRRENVPHFGLAPLAILPVIGVHLYAEALTGKQQFHEQGQVATGEIPRFADEPIAILKPGRETRTAPHALA